MVAPSRRDVPLPLQRLSSRSATGRERRQRDRFVLVSAIPAKIAPITARAALKMTHGLKKLSPSRTRDVIVSTWDRTSKDPTRIVVPRDHVRFFAGSSLTTTSCTVQKRSRNAR